MHQNQKRPVFSGTLYINDVFIARVSCCGRKLLKHQVYDAALHVLKNTSAQHLLTQNILEQRLPQKSTLAIDKVIKVNKYTHYIVLFVILGDMLQLLS